MRNRKTAQANEREETNEAMNEDTSARQIVPRQWEHQTVQTSVKVTLCIPLFTLLTDFFDG